ncbi:MAG: hypothetical protein JRH01_10645 [Deltaproteobacteria bacterium]|nr:hypothetical protein [Deltaproteobacteria bacterium]MBW2395793.1 hypothetical protein [Deltaproteobacteria bacterium]
MRTIDSTLVDIARDFLIAHQALQQVVAHHRAGELRFEEVVALVGDDEKSVLFRLKECCHRVFRATDTDAEIGPGALFDLAIGSLFHEAMKFRENVYTRDVYGPRVSALRKAGVADEGGLLREFEKIVADSGVRLEESLFEAETLLRQTTGQFRVLLVANASNAYVTRFLIAQADDVAGVMGKPLEGVLEDIHGSAAAGYAQAAASYLSSGFFEAGVSALEAADRLGYPAEEISRLGAYAQGMQAFLEGRFTDAIASLGAWLEARPGKGEAHFARLAFSALSKVGPLVVGEDEERALSDGATALAERIRREVPFEGEASAA